MSIFIAFIVLFWAGVADAFYYKVTASDYVEPNRPTNAIDDDRNTHWTCRGECWIQLDVEEVWTLNEVYIEWKNDSKRLAFFDIVLSTDHRYGLKEAVPD